MHRTLLALIPCVVTFACPSTANDEVDKLIDQLTEVTEPGVGYSAYFSGSTFLPYADAEQLATFVFGGTYRSESNVLRAIVAKGAEAVPSLLKHLSDDRKTALEPLGAIMWMDFPDEYDYNVRTRNKAPPNVNRDTLDSKEIHPNSHTVTVGDLCFVAIGQIVNRNYCATRYQPTGGLIVNSPTYSKRLRDVLIADLSNLTTETHRHALIQDFRNPDHEDRRIGAYRRLCYYYPNAVEPLVLETLEQPTIDTLKTWDFCRETLYPAQPGDRQRLCDEFIRENGHHYVEAVLQMLFDDLSLLEAHEGRRLFPPLTDYTTEPREILIQLFGKPPSVKSTDRPTAHATSDFEYARFIGSLIHDESKRIGDVVKQVYIERSNDDNLAPACLRCLANRGYGEFLVEQLDLIDYAANKTNPLHSGCLEAIATSKAQRVQERLLQVLKQTDNDTYFLHALAGLGDVEDKLVWDNATRILKTLPDDTDRGDGILQLIAERFPDTAEDTFKTFLSTGSAKRAETMCRVLWYDHPLSCKVLAPSLDDRRELSGFSIPIRVCDRAAQAISNAIDEIEFNSEWPRRRKDATIVKLKKHCLSQR